MDEATERFLADHPRCSCDEPKRVFALFCGRCGKPMPDAKPHPSLVDRWIRSVAEHSPRDREIMRRNMALHGPAEDVEFVHHGTAPTSSSEPNEMNTEPCGS